MQKEENGAAQEAPQEASQEAKKRKYEDISVDTAPSAAEETNVPIKAEPTSDTECKPAEKKKEKKDKKKKKDKSKEKSDTEEKSEKSLTVEEEVQVSFMTKKLTE